MKKIFFIQSLIVTTLFSDVHKEFNVVIDDKSNLMWQDSYDDPNIILKEDEVAPIKYSPWSDAVAYCSDLQLDGYSDWRLPSLKELRSLLLLDKKVYPDTFISPYFEYVALSAEESYWTNTTREHFSGLAMAVNFYMGKEHIGVKTTKYYSRCVRDKQ
jgi:hypothetical protein